MKQFKKAITLTLIMGAVYLDIEILIRALRGDLVKAGFHDVKWISLAGWTSIWTFSLADSVDY
jgi:hypothetical protein